MIEAPKIELPEIAVAEPSSSRARTIFLGVIYLVTFALLTWFTVEGYSYYQTPYAERTHHEGFGVFRPAGSVGLARQPGNVMAVSYRKSAFFRVKKKNEDAINKLIASRNIHPFFDSEVVEVRPESVILKTKDGTIELPNDYVIVQNGGIPPFDMLKSMGIRFGGDQKPISALTAG